MKMIYLSMNTLSTISPFLKHPISLGSVLMIQSIMSTAITIMLTKNSWYSMVLLITFSGGIMIMFIYMSSIASNEKFKFSKKLVYLMLMTTTMLILMLKDKMLIANKWMENQISFQENEEIKSILKMLTTKKKTSIMIMIMVMFMLVYISKIVSTIEGPLKKTYV
nr:NADH dehydrogenase subunit 6 [Borysthenes sp. 1 WQW-2023a]